MRRKAKILAVDDDPVNIAIIEEVLGEAYQLECLMNGQETLAKVRSFQPDVVLLDIMMPGVSGYDVCRELRAHSGQRNLKIVLVSAKAMPSERLEGYRAGADDYITKPFNLLEFRAKVQVYVHLRAVEEVNHLKTAVVEQLGADAATPLSVIRAHAESLAKTQPLPEQERCQLAARVLEAALRLGKLGECAGVLGDIRLGEVHVPESRTDVAAIVRNQAAAVAAKHQSRGVQIATAVPPSLIADAPGTAIELIVEALLDNAAQSSPKGSTIHVAVSDTANRARITVTDRGPGPSESVLQQLLGTATGRDTQRGGRGGILQLAKAMVEALGGEIVVTAPPGGGNEFAVGIPLSRLCGESDGESDGESGTDPSAHAAA